MPKISINAHKIRKKDSQKCPQHRGRKKDAQRIRLGRDIVTKVESLPGVQHAAIATMLPVSYNGNTDWIRFVGKPYDGKHIEVNERDVSSEYFNTIWARLVCGRYLCGSEDESKPRVVIINQTLANRYFPGEDPIGSRSATKA